MQKTFKTSGMHCKSCVILVADAVLAIDGVKSVKPDYSKNEVEVFFDRPETEAAIRNAIEKEGYKVIG